MRSVGGGSGGEAAVAHTSRTGCVVGGCTGVAGRAAVLQAKGLKTHLVVLGQDGLHLQAVVKGARHMEGHNAGGHGALGAERDFKCDFSVHLQCCQGSKTSAAKQKDKPSHNKHRSNISADSLCNLGRVSVCVCVCVCVFLSTIDYRSYKEATFFKVPSGLV